MQRSRLGTYTVIDNIFDDFSVVKGLFDSSLFGMSDCFSRLTDNVADVVFPVGPLIKRLTGKKIKINSGALIKAGDVSPRYKTSVAVFPMEDGDVNGISLKENQCLLVEDFEELNIKTPCAVVMYSVDV